ncbi:MAG: P-II family nitrogen regulator [Thermoleophilaceae bacterium]
MKMVVAYVDPERFEGIRDDLAEEGFGTLSLLSATGSVPEATLSGSYRGAAVEGHTRPKARLECIVGAEYTDSVVDTVLKNGGERTFVFVLPVEQAHPVGSVKTEEVVAKTG